MNLSQVSSQQPVAVCLGNYEMKMFNSTSHGRSSGETAVMTSKHQHGGRCPEGHEVKVNCVQRMRGT